MDTRLAGKIGGDKTAKYGKAYYSMIGKIGSSKRWNKKNKNGIIDTSWKPTQKTEIKPKKEIND